MARLRPLGNDFLEAGCDLSFVDDAITDEEADAMLYDPEDEGIPEAALLAAPRLALASVGRDLTLANRLRVAGLDVVEVQGWRTRGDATFNGKGNVSHHTAGAATGAAPSLNVCVNGRSDLPGPLCNDFLGRDLKVRVVASGRANHAGVGGWRGLSGNSSVWGTECEHTGTSMMPDAMVVVLVRMTAAHLLDTALADMACQHREWSTAGKIDIARNFLTTAQANEFRGMVREQLRLLADVTRSRIIYPTSTWKRTQRHPRGQWVRKSVVVATGNVEEWIEKRPAIKERRGAGAGIEILPVAA